ncbi:MAG: DUF2505 domain-containing protein [Tetrasphaera sp.]|jgi:hypothetical protein|nr:DUF2505 domain-containing protein [Tetrasphaera sp.]
MRIAKTVELLGSPDAVFRLRTTARFQEAKCVASRAVDHAVEIDEIGDHTLVRTRRTMSTEAFPDTARSMVGPSLVLDETQDWGPPTEDGSRSASVRLVLDGLPMGLTGNVTVRPAESGSGSVQTLEGELRANIPLLGGRIEKLAMPAVDAGFDIEALLLNEWLFDA